jgi:hypothetical protein
MVTSNLVRRTRFWNKVHQVRVKFKRVKTQIILKALGARKPICLNRKTNMSKQENQEKLKIPKGQSEVVN